MTGLKSEDQTNLRQLFPWLREAVVCDGLLPWSRRFLPPGADLAAQLARFKAVGFNHISLTLASGFDTASDALVNLGEITNRLAGTEVAVAHTAPEIEAQAQAGGLSASFHFQTATPFGESLDLVDAFYAAGVGRAILAYNQANRFADGCHEQRDAGLTAQGAALVERMDRVGMRVDLSHCGRKTSLDVLEMRLETPPVFSHSNARALFNHERNISDEQLRKAAKAGSYIGLNGVGFFLGAEGRDIPKEMARHAAHIAEFVGPDRIGLGLDFMYLERSDYSFFHAARSRWPRGYPEPPWSFLQPEGLGSLCRELLNAGFSRAEVTGILGRNYLNHMVARRFKAG